MAQASEELLIKIDIVDSDSANRINEISEELNHLKVTQKDYEQAVKEGKQLTTEQAKEYVAVKARIADLNKEVNAHVKALQKENQEPQMLKVADLNSAENPDDWTEISIEEGDALVARWRAEQEAKMQQEIRERYL